MKTLKLIAAVAAVALVATACQEKPEPVKPEAEAKVIALTPSLYAFNRATDTAFEEGDAIGLHIVTPTSTWLDNAKYTYQNGKLVGAQVNEWYTDESVLSDVVAYYPYSTAGAYSAEGYTFTVNADQSSARKYSASDLMVAYTTSRPTKDAVVLPFKHALSKVVINIDNQLGEDIAAVWFSDIYGTATVNAKSGEVTTSGSQGTIKAAKGANGTSWSLIVAPQQNVSPKLMVTTAISQKQYTFVLDAPVSFASGKVSTASISLTKQSISTSFTTEITDWVADNNLNFGQPSEGGESGGNGGGESGESVLSAYSVIGSIGGDVWTIDHPMYLENGMYVAKNLTISVGDEFKVRKDGKWDEAYGAASSNNLPMVCTNFVTTGQANIVAQQGGIFDIYMNVACGFIALVPAGNTLASEMANVNLAIIGNGDWVTDGQRLVFENGAFVAKDVTIVSAFKIRKDSAWTDSWGWGDATVAVQTGGVKNTVYYNGGDIPAVSGTFNIWFDGCNVWFE